MDHDDASDIDEPLPEYDFTDAAQGLVAKRYGLKRAKQLVELDEDVQKVFYDSQSVNEALRLLIKISRETAAPKHPVG